VALHVECATIFSDHVFPGRAPFPFAAYWLIVFSPVVVGVPLSVAELVVSECQRPLGFLSLF